MANFNWSMTWADISGNTSNVGGHMVADSAGDAVLILEAIAEILSPVLAVNPILNGVLTEVTLTQVVDFSAWQVKTAAAAGSENQKGGRFILRAGSAPSAKLTFPTFNEFYKQSSGYLDPTDTVIAALISQLTNGDVADNRYDPFTALTSTPYFTYGGKPAYK